MITTLRARRHLLVSAGACALGLVSARAWATPGAADSRSLLVFLRGGYDAISALVPRSSFYRELRPNIAIQRATALDGAWSLHPALQASLLPLVQQGQAVFVPFAGVTVPTRSHFETQDRIELGGPDTGPRDTRSGFMNRLAQRLGAQRPVPVPIAFSERLPLALRGPAEVANVALSGRARPADGALQRAVEAMYRDSPLGERVRQGYAVREDVRRDAMASEAAASAALGTDSMGPPMATAGDPGHDREMAAASRGAPTAGRFETEARRMARLMREKHTLAFVDVGGWDTHVNQGADEGPLADRLQELGRGLAGFAQEIGPALWARTTVVVISEFGRTLRENGNRGTDHGHGSVYWVLGGGLRPAPAGLAPVRGEQVAIDASTLHENRDLPVLQDVRGLLGGLWARQYGLSRADLDVVFPGATPRELDLL